MTVNKLVEEHIRMQMPYWEPATLNSTTSVYRVHIKNSIGKKKANKVTADMIETFYNNMLNDKEKPVKIGMVESVNKILNAAFNLAVKRHLIRNNPVTGCVGAVKRKNDIEETIKQSLEDSQQGKLLEFIRNTPKYACYYPFFYILAWTGCRIGELLGLTWYDLDFGQEIISINHKITYTKVDGYYQFVLGQTKTVNGNREIPMLADVKDILLELKQAAGWAKISMIRKTGIKC